MMVNCDLLSEKEEGLIQAALLKRISNVYVYTLEYKEGLKICAFIQLAFESSISLIITTGKLADNIVLLDETDFYKEKDKYSLQDDVEMKVNVFKNFKKIIGGKLLNVECVQKLDEEYYWQLNFVFEKSTLHIDALIDEVEFYIIE